ncbi:hypothetical protein [Sporomusa malonica]|uniref:Uncharacterized protein n=1 Tax=Sporomusa malonica TaxID=112901 RepID=A0A1W2CYU9_9FIRM|nr:hypothetical protein SAMN04488500_112101 [Sporomusa malonica]
MRMLGKMYNKRLNGYAEIGYRAKGETAPTDSINIIFDKSNFLPVYMNDIVNAVKEIVIVSPFITKRRAKVTVTIVTRQAEDFEDKNRNALSDLLN